MVECVKKPFSKLFNLIDKSEMAHDEDLVHVSLENIVPNQYQPRAVFDQDKIKELAHSIEKHGLLQPITLRPIEEDMYEIIAGERRFRALKYLAYENTKAIVKYLTDQETAAIALIENIQRENLTSIEEARAYKQLLDMDDVTQKDLAESIGKSQSFIANKLRLLKLSDDVITALEKEEITERHARALLSLDNDCQYDVLNNIVSDKLTVKETELAVKNRQKKRTEQINFNDDVTFVLNDFERDIKKLREKGMDIRIENSETNDFHEVIIKIYK